MLGRLFKSSSTSPNARPIGEPEPEPLRMDPDTLDAAADLAALAERLEFGGNDAAAIRQGMVAPDLAEWVRAVDILRQPSRAQVLSELSALHKDTSEKAARYRAKGQGDLSGRFERASLYVCNALTFVQAAYMAEAEKGQKDDAS